MTWSSGDTLDSGNVLFLEVIAQVKKNWPVYLFVHFSIYMLYFNKNFKGKKANHAAQKTGGIAPPFTC